MSSDRALLWFLSLCLLPAAGAVYGRAADSPAGSVQLANDVSVRRLAESVWIHTSVSELGSFGKVSSNGMVLINSGDAILIDTPATEAQTEVLFAWAAHQLRRPIRYVVITHAHTDRIGGIALARRHHAATYSIDLTMALARKSGYLPPEHRLPYDGNVILGKRRIDVFFPGAGHAPDNIVIWLADKRFLFGGCFVKEAASRTIGNLGDANLQSWHPALDKVIARYPDAQWVIPGHGEPGGRELLARTAELIRAAQKQ